MAIERNPNDPFNEDPAANDLRRSTRLDQELQADPELTEGRVSGGRIAAAWMHRKGNVHDFAITNGKGPRLHHFAYWVPGPLNIIHLCDVMASNGYIKNLERGPGRHGISNAFFLYIRDPDGHRIELYCSDYQTMDHDHEPLRWSLRDPRRQTLWGAPAPRSWFEQGSEFVGEAVREPAFVADVVIADFNMRHPPLRPAETAMRCFKHMIQLGLLGGGSVTDRAVRVVPALPKNQEQ